MLPTFQIPPKIGDIFSHWKRKYLSGKCNVDLSIIGNLKLATLYYTPISFQEDPKLNSFFFSMHLGWYYVERLADGQKGWVPISATREIESNHIRARNFKQRHAFLKLLTSMSATENNGHDLLNNNNNQTNKYHVTFEDWNATTCVSTTKNTSAPRATAAALVPKRDEESICFWIFSFKFYWCRTKTQLCYTTNVIFTAKYYYEIDHKMPFLRNN